MRDTNLWIHHRPAIRKAVVKSLLCQFSKGIQPLTSAGLTPRKSLGVNWKFSTKFADFTSNGSQHLLISRVLQSTDNEIANLLNLFFFYSLHCYVSVTYSN